MMKTRTNGYFTNKVEDGVTMRILVGLELDNLWNLEITDP